ncbi:MAG: hypothetical protein JST22_12405 [Bacteroidetes bacterium]|nr:hypothetical protein [Bacteroidota bacterium]
MNKRMLYPMVAALATLLALAIVPAASAQSINNVCCGFVIAANNSIPANCFPFNVKTVWAGAGQTNSIPGTGQNGFQITGCPPTTPATLDAITINGTTVTPGSPGNITLACGVCVFVHCSYDANGCIIIHLSICP